MTNNEVTVLKKYHHICVYFCLSDYIHWPKFGERNDHVKHNELYFSHVQILALNETLRRTGNHEGFCQHYRNNEIIEYFKNVVCLGHSLTL